jgi:hypothetical protein
MNMYEMVMLMIWDMNACLTPRGVTVPKCAINLVEYNDYCECL